VVSRATGLNPPIDNVDARRHDETDLCTQPEFARSLDFSGKSALHARQLPSLHGVFTPSAEELGWAQAILDAFDAAGEAVKPPNGEFADLPVADRPWRLLVVADGPLAGAPGVFSALETETDAPCRRDGVVYRRGGWFRARGEADDRRRGACAG
jgi:citrate lyase subunit beta / citryl-CoA lyase